MTILIPAYQPDRRLTALVEQLQALAATPIVIVDDGSDQASQPIFQDAAGRGCVVLRHEQNLGKGQALKTGLRWLRQLGTPAGVVCADCDGQHLPEDILRVAGAVAVHPNAIVLGSRRFEGSVPWRSRFGNAVTGWVFRLVTREQLADTQTGLRGFSSTLLDWLCAVPGDRFEYEMNVLLQAVRAGIPLALVEISTVYPPRQHTSHFHTVRDALRVYLPIMRFAASSVVGGGLDFLLLLGLHSLTGLLWLSVMLARLGSAAANYTLNRRLVFASAGRVPHRRSLPRYALLAAGLLLCNYLLLVMLTARLSLPLVLAKPLVELLLFTLSYRCQQRLVFSPDQRQRRP